MTGDVRTGGPLFDGRAEAALRRGIEDARGKVADRGKRLVTAAFAGSIRDDRGVFLSRITTTREPKTVTTHSGHKSYTMAIPADPATEDIVTVDLATYGPWLEGTGSRNETTRFKGYHGFRKAGQELDRIAAGITDDALAPHVREMNQ